jgi:hypothetical protein
MIRAVMSRLLGISIPFFGRPVPPIVECERSGHRRAASSKLPETRAVSTGRRSTHRACSALAVEYGFYVYHDLLHDFYSDLAHRLSPRYAYPFTLLIAFTGTLLIATLSYRLLENPLLRLKERFASQVHTAPPA